MSTSTSEGSSAKSALLGDPKLSGLSGLSPVKDGSPKGLGLSGRMPLKEGPSGRIGDSGVSKSLVGEAGRAGFSPLKSGAPGFPGFVGSWMKSSLLGLSADAGAEGEAGDSGSSKSRPNGSGESGLLFYASNDCRIFAMKTSNSSSYLIPSTSSPCLNSILSMTSSGFISVSTSKGSSALLTSEPTSMPEP